ncbi:MAG: hypothetical protein IJN77_08350 [Oscillospiraceae bacterium]|nr:hypothetical protein [Oscillospiraceae bacterium]
MWPDTHSTIQPDYMAIYNVMLPLKPIGNYKGFWLLISVIEEIFKQKNIKYNLSRDIYPPVARLFECNPKSIERCIRTLLLNIDMSALAGITGATIPENITVSQIIDILVVHLLTK